MSTPSAKDKEEERQDHEWLAENDLLEELPPEVLAKLDQALVRALCSHRGMRERIGRLRVLMVQKEADIHYLERRLKASYNHSGKLLSDLTISRERTNTLEVRINQLMTELVKLNTVRGKE